MAILPSARALWASVPALHDLRANAGNWAADTWTRLNTNHFAGKLEYHGIVFGLTEHGHSLGHTYDTGRITLHISLLDPRGRAWLISDHRQRRRPLDGFRLRCGRPR